MCAVPRVQGFWRAPQRGEIKVWSVPYQRSDGKCNDSVREYVPEYSHLCCKKCPPGQRLKKKCSESEETECESCPKGRYITDWNYSPNCFSCSKCKTIKGLQPAQNCSSTANSNCVCQPGMYCFMGFDESNEQCSECQKYTECNAGFGVSVSGKANKDVKCEPCPAGTFSDTVSYTDPCRPHTNCHGRAVVQTGNTTSDTVCESGASTQPQTSTSEPAYTTSSPGMRRTDMSYPTKSPSLSTETDNKLVAVITTVIILLLIIIIIWRCIRKAIRNKDTARFPKVDANGNCQSGDEINQTQLTSFTVTTAEQQCLLEKVEDGNDLSQCSSNTDTLTRTDGCSSHESISPLQSTLALDNPYSALSEPMTLMSNTEPITPQPSIPTESSFQSTSPQIISPVTPSPQVNVNITFHIGNGSSKTSSVIPTDSCVMQTDPKLPFGEEEECSCIPQQEAGKQSLMSVQESTSYST
ncbi:tumor necrosis factor receptor superfamily member 1B isoform X1 [Thunnus albacares]|uniref:tumor necrosis factor receptor superfamily member 1B isoform X1 n=1 Tax=Thunnus albacares TaxID=8236 RepID=UPI001CF6ED32|nr:tumor necrosis factor receptor superfamily member 1B isoform X1 [Thunnus albacares]